MDHVEYFFFKNGGGNAWTAHTIEHGELYVGFHDFWTALREQASKRDPSLRDRTTFDFLLDEDFDAVKPKLDVRHIHDLARTCGESTPRGLLLTFTPGWLFVWRVTGPLREHRPDTKGWMCARDQWLRFCAPIGAEPDATLAARRNREKVEVVQRGDLSAKALDQLLRHVEFQDAATVLANPALRKKAEKRYEKNFDYRFKIHKDVHGLPIRMLPVALVAKVPRQALFTSVDSISVYRNLNSNTCTSLRTATGTDQTEIAGAVDDLPVGHGGQDHVVGHRLPDEKPFGRFLRLYLNQVVTRYWIGPAKPVLPLLRPDDSGDTLPMVLNPILVETAALALLRDVGLTPDIGVGKGMDVVDVRARAAGRDGLLDRDRAKGAAERLSAIISKFGEPGDSHALCLSRLEEYGVLDVQCKAASDKIGVARQDILFIGYPRVNLEVVGKNNQRPTPPTLSIIALARWAVQDAAEDSELRRFFAMQAAVLRGEWTA